MSEQNSSVVTLGIDNSSARTWSGSESIAHESPVTTGSDKSRLSLGWIIAYVLLCLLDNPNIFAVTVPSSITSLSPTTGPVGLIVTIAGANFGNIQGASTITFGGVAAQ